MGTGTFAAVLIGVMLLLLISIVIRQKNKLDEAAIRRKVRSILIEETTGVSVNEGLKLPERVGGDIYFWSLSKSEYDRLSHGPVRMDGKVRFEPLVNEDRMTMIRLRGGRG